METTDQNDPALIDSILDAALRCVRSGGGFSLEEYCQRYPELADELRVMLPALILLEIPYEESAQSPADRSAGEFPLRIGRYRIERVLGRGGFGLVYLAHDEQLHRAVAIKVPHPKRISKPEDADAYLVEARTVANLDHPGIVPVHDVGSSADCPCYVVSKYISGIDLATKIKQHRFQYREVAELVATVADALHYAHKQGLVHRDVKPANILISADGNPYLVDFGLALREEDFGTGPTCAGTPAYMSPEQAREEGHRVDGRSDIFSLGVELYELLAGRHPFRGETLADLYDQVTSYDARPLRQFDEKLPRELERICHTAMAKRASERYSNAHDMAEDLRHFLKEPVVIQSGSWPVGIALDASGARVAPADSKSVGSSNASSTKMGADSSVIQPIRIVPKGLRSFDAHDADFFLELLPGPRDREGLPTSLRFWKTRIEETDPDNTFSVGLIYGPSGCGKSSLVKAGLLPRISDDVITVYIESTSEETETRLLQGLRKRCPFLDDNLSLKETLAELRRGHGLPFGKKVLIVLDQFEQWLHATKEEENTVLVQALRQCDGGRVQCIVMVRDDFWLAVSRFLRELEVRLLEGENSALVDLFDLNHARQVLVLFGQAFGKLPKNIGAITSQQRDFVKQSVADLAEEGKVICVRLALFAEMMKGKVWTPATLRDVGGTTGVGVTFLEETFSAPTAPPERRYHQMAARAILKTLLPDPGTNIKGQMKSSAELWAASGYESRPKEFADLIQILDREIRLITPTDPDGHDDYPNRKLVPDRSESNEQVGHFLHGEGGRYFQLTHDYLVPSLREWLTCKQRETRRGRAELKLAERSTLWNANRENRYLPSLLEWLNIRTLTNSRRWTPPEQLMMNRAFRVLGKRTGLITAAVLGFVAVAIFFWGRVNQRQEATRIEGLVGRLSSAEPVQLPVIIQELDGNPRVAATFLSPLVSAEATTVDENRSRLHARLATVARDHSLIEPLLEELLTNKDAYVGPIRQQLRPFAGELTDKLWGILRDHKAEVNRRFRAAMALVDYVPESAGDLWTEQDLQFVAKQLVAANAEYQPLLRDYLRPIRARLLPDLAQVFGDAKSNDAQRLSAANAFADFAANDITTLSPLLAVATPAQFDVLYPIVASAPTPSTVTELSKIAATLPPTELDPVGRVPFGQHRANAAVTLLRLGEREKVLPVFDLTDDPEALTQFIFRSRDRGVRAEELLECLRIVNDGPINRFPRHSRYALLLALGEYTLDEIPAAPRAGLLKQLADWYANDPSADVHGAVGWLLRQWGQQEIVRRVDRTAVPYCADREWFTLAITTAPSKSEEKPSQENAESLAEAESEPHFELPAPKTFYFTFIVFPAGDYEIGSVENEPHRSKPTETRHAVHLTEPVALLDREIRFEELITFSQKFSKVMRQFDANPQDAGYGPDWYDSVAFCRWLSQQRGLSESDQSYADPESLNEVEFLREPNPDVDWAPRNWPLDLGRRGFRLPTESEWEVACRSGTRTTFGYGSDEALLDRFGWVSTNSGKHVHPPQKLRPSLRGVFDLHGNLFEWTHDWYKEYGVAALTDPLGAKEGSSRIFRGGSWEHDAALCRAAARATGIPTDRAGYVGFRLAFRLSEPTSKPESFNGADSTDGRPLEANQEQQR